MKEKEIPLEERIEKIFESGWVNEFNYLEQLMQETRSCLYKLQQELQRKDNNWNELKKFLIDLQKLKGINQQGFSWGVCQECLDKIKELEKM